MKSGAACTLVRTALALVLVAGTVPSRAQEQQPTLEQLLGGFSSMRGLSARFTERKQIALLVAPLESSGEVHFAAPDRLLRKVSSPSPSTVLLDGNQLTMASNGRREQIDLSTQPVVAAFVDSFRQVLRGDRVALDRTYRVGFTTGERGWRLTLRPKQGPLRRFLVSLEIRGSAREIRSMRLLERSGDVTVTEFSDVRADRRWTPAQIRRIFRLP
jgi:outer membrane lipoprotein-sorting protein